MIDYTTFVLMRGRKGLSLSGEGFKLTSDQYQWVEMEKNQIKYWQEQNPTLKLTPVKYTDETGMIVQPFNRYDRVKASSSKRILLVDP